MIRGRPMVACRDKSYHILSAEYFAQSTLLYLYVLRVDHVGDRWKVRYSAPWNCVRSAIQPECFTTGVTKCHVAVDILRLMRGIRQPIHFFCHSSQSTFGSLCYLAGFSLPLLHLHFLFRSLSSWRLRYTTVRTGLCKLWHSRKESRIRLCSFPVKRRWVSLVRWLFAIELWLFRTMWFGNFVRWNWW